MAILEYDLGAAFSGVISRTAEESGPAWPASVRARESQNTSLRPWPATPAR
jgi:hypothetical protein